MYYVRVQLGPVLDLSIPILTKEYDIVHKIDQGQIPLLDTFEDIMEKSPLSFYKLELVNYFSRHLHIAI